MLLNIVERAVDPDITVIEVSGRLALGRESQRIETLAEDLSKRGSPRVVIDLSAVEYIDSAGIGILALASGKVKEAGGKLALVAPDGKVMHMLKLTQMDVILTVRGSVNEALAAV
jgi:anti-sigma B factor antagonist